LNVKDFEQGRLREAAARPRKGPSGGGSNERYSTLGPNITLEGSLQAIKVFRLNKQSVSGAFALCLRDDG
jgi:hypothetical protein